MKASSSPTSAPPSQPASPFTQSDSFRELYEAHFRSVYATALAILKDADAASDVVHDAFLRAWQRAGQYDPVRGNAGVWLRAIARNLSIDRLRASDKRAASEAIGPDSCAASADIVSELAARRALETVSEAMRALPPIYRHLIELAYDEGLSHAEIAQRLRQPLGTVKSRLRHAVALLRASSAKAPRQPPFRAETPCAPFTTMDTHGIARDMSGMSRLNLLIVDDDVETLRLAAAILRKFNVCPRLRTSANDGVAALVDSWPDVLIADLNMPEHDGYWLLGRARSIAENRSPLRTAAFTSLHGEQERSKALIAGFDVYINKPVHPLALVSTICTLSN